MQTHTNVHAVEQLTGNLNVSPNYFDTSFVSQEKKTKKTKNKQNRLLSFLPSFQANNKGEGADPKPAHSAEGRESPGHVASLSQS